MILRARQQRTPDDATLCVKWLRGCVERAEKNGKHVIRINTRTARRILDRFTPSTADVGGWDDDNELDDLGVVR
jgi:hypothetical protein